MIQYLTKYYIKKSELNHLKYILSAQIDVNFVLKIPLKSPSRLLQK